MATKKSPRKKKKSPSRRNIIFLIIATVLSALIIWATISTARQQQLEREDGEKFILLEGKMEELKSKLDVVSGERAWQLKKSCSKPGIKFYTGDAGGCSISLSLTGASGLLEKDYRDILKGIGKAEPLFYSEYSNANFIDFSVGIEDVFCSLSFDNDSSGQVNNPLFSCRSSSLHMYYPEQ